MLTDRSSGRGRNLEIADYVDPSTGTCLNQKESLGCVVEQMKMAHISDCMIVTICELYRFFCISYSSAFDLISSARTNAESVSEMKSSHLYIGM